VALFVGPDQQGSIAAKLPLVCMQNVQWGRKAPFFVTGSFITAMHRTIARFGAPLALFLITLAILWPAIHGDLFFDDIPSIVGNKAIQLTDLTPASLLAAAISFSQGPIGRPIPMLSFALDWYLAGANPTWFKLVNLLIHAANTVLVFFLVRRLLRLHRRLDGQDADDTQPQTVALLAALLWAIAPIHGFTVVYVVQRMVLLGGLFTLAALHAWLSLREAAGRGATARVVGFAGLLGGASLLALACKETAVLIPFYIAVTEVFLFQSRGLGRLRRPIITAIWLAVLTPILALAYTVWSNPEGIHAGYALRPFTAEERMLTQARVLVMYLRNIIIPDYGQLHFFFDNLPISRSLTEPITTGLSIALLSMLAAAGLLLRRRLPLFGFAIWWFLAGQALESSFWSLELVFWHRNYLPALGPLVAIAAGLVWLTRQPGLARAAGVGGMVVLLALSGIQSWMIATDWGDRISIARAEVIKNPGSARANHYYGRTALLSYDRDRDPKLLAEAQRFFTRALDQDARTLLPAYGLLFIAVKYQTGTVAGPLREVIQRAATQPLAMTDLSVFDGIVGLRADHPAVLDVFDVLEVLDSAAQNPALTDQQRAYALSKKAELLAKEGFPASVYMPVLRHAVCLMSWSPDYRFLLFRTLVEHGEIDEAETLLSPPFSRLERIKEPRIDQYEAALRTLLELRRKGDLSLAPTDPVPLPNPAR